MLWESFAVFPKGTVFLAVVDPGVGSPRRVLAVQTVNYFFVGPDNGVLSSAVNRDKVKKIIVVDAHKAGLKRVSRTFAGRDLFAAVAAYLSGGGRIDRLGEAAGYMKQACVRAFIVDRGVLTARIAHIDAFGNLITNIRRADLERFTRGAGFKAVLKGRSVNAFYEYYGQAAAAPFFIEGSSGFLEISLKNKSAGAYFGVKYSLRDVISIRPVKKRVSRRKQ